MALSRRRIFLHGPPAGIDWLAAILTMAWAVLLALGLGLAFLSAALLQLAAAAFATGSRRTAGPGQDR